LLTDCSDPWSAFRRGDDVHQPLRFSWKLSNPLCGIVEQKIKRVQRYPQYSDQEMEPYFIEMSAGYCCKQAAKRCGYPWEWVENTLYSDDDTLGHVLDLSMVAGEKIRNGAQDAPDRWDGLYDEYRN
jgi:hypothetical protein